MFACTESFSGAGDLLTEVRSYRALETTWPPAAVFTTQQTLVVMSPQGVLVMVYPR